MGDDDECLAVFFAEGEEETLQFFGVVRVEVTGRFVGKDYRGTVDECASDGHTLFLSTRHFGWLMVGTMREGEEVEEFECESVCFVTVLAADECGKHDVLESGELGQELMELEDETDVLVAEIGECLLVERVDVDTINDD